MLDALLLPLGIATAKAVARIWIKSEFALTISDKLVESLASRVPGLSERRRTARQFQDMADRVADQLRPLVEHEQGGLEENELQAAIIGVADLIDSMQDIDADLLFAIDLEPSQLEKLLRSQAAFRVRGDLAEPAQLMFDRLLQENCTFIVELALGLPDFNAAALTEVLRRETEIIDRVKDILSKIPQPAALQADADQDFNTRYRRHIARELDKLELFGLNLGENTSRYDLSIAYITLSASQSENATQRPLKDILGGDVLGEGKGAASEEPEARGDLRVDEALSRTTRHLIRGEAGSGKTTLLRWLAVTAARSAFADHLRAWNGYVPFFLQLRRYANEDLPAPEEFLGYVAPTIAGLMPAGWVHRQLIAGRALILIDGVDELPERQRLAARNWLFTLLEEFSDCRYVITTRPPAVPSDWLQSGDFGLFELLPMAMSDIVTFVQHWHDAAKSAVVHIAGESDVLDRYQVELNRIIGNNPTIRNLATTPLLCAMLCALNRERRTQLPRDRMELYRVALESLLDRRDTEREISQQETLQLSLREKQLLLENLAYWLVRNDQTDVATDDAVQHIADHLAYMTSVHADAQSVFKYLLTRSGLIREPVAGRVDFIHRTFQEYLAAARAISQADIPLLIQKAHDDGWREVVILSAGHANEAQCNSLLLGLLERGNQSEPLRHRLHLLAVACLETAIELSPSTRSAVEEALAGTLPPSNMTEARAVASAGPLAAPLLSQFSGSLAATSAACVRALCLIGEEQALAALEAFRSDTRVTVKRELVRGWDSFDRGEYARRILSEGNFIEKINLTEIDKLAALRYFSTMPDVSFVASGGIKSLSILANPEAVTSLSIREGHALADLDGIEDFTRLTRLQLSDNRNIAELPPLPLSLKMVDLRHMERLSDLREIALLPSLMSLSVTGMEADGPSLRHSVLTDLTITNSDLAPYEEWISDLINLRNLSLTNLSEFVGLRNTDFEWLSARDSLMSMSMWGMPAIRSMNGLPSGITHLHLQNLDGLEDAAALGLLHNLNYLMLDTAPRLSNFEFLTRLDSLTTLDLERAPLFDDLTSISATDLEILNIAGTRVSSLEPLAAMPSVRVLMLDGAPISNLDVLRQMPALMRVRLSRSQRALLDDDLRNQHYFSFASDDSH